MIAICTPSRDSVQATFAYDLVRMIQATEVSCIFTISLGSSIQNNRTHLVRECINNGISHILFIDSDMCFPPYTANRLLKHDRDFVAANCIQRLEDKPTAFKNGSWIDSRGKKGIEKVDSVGFGVALIKTYIFTSLGEPWFGTPFDGKKYVGEDVFFCKKATEHGVEIFIDHDLSKDVRHSGFVEHSFDGFSRPK